MRRLSKEEQDLCSRILSGSGQNNFLGNIIDHKLKGVCIAITKTPQNVNLEFTIRNITPTSEEAEAIINRINNISFFILTTVSLIKILEKEGYILLIQRTTQSSNNTKFGGCVKNLPSVTNQFTDEGVSDLLVKYCDKEILATEEFKHFCKRKFTARDEQRFKIQFKVSMLALCITTIALVVNIVFNILSEQPNKTLDFKQEKMEQFSKEFKLMKKKVDSIANKDNVEIK